MTKWRDEIKIDFEILSTELKSTQVQGTIIKWSTCP